MTRVLAPCPGTVLAMADVPDPVFAEEMVGPGVAIAPADGPTTVVSPIAGRVLKVHPHAFVVLGEGVGVLLHLGINTVHLEGRGFEVLAVQGARGRHRRPDDPLGPLHHLLARTSRPSCRSWSWTHPRAP